MGGGVAIFGEYNSNAAAVPRKDSTPIPFPSMQVHPDEDARVCRHVPAGLDERRKPLPQALHRRSSTDDVPTAPPDRHLVEPLAGPRKNNIMALTGSRF